MMTNEEKIKAIHTWAHSFKIVPGDSRWYAKIMYTPKSFNHTTVYFNYDQMIDVTYQLVSMRIHGFIKNTLGSIYDH